MPKAASPVPEYRAQLATRVETAPSGDCWLHELEYDGYRLGCIIEAGVVRLESPEGNDCTKQFPEVVAAAKRLKVKRALFDGDVAVVLPDGKTSFQALRNALAGGSRAGLTYFVFDLLHCDGRNTAELPLEQRKAECERLLAPLGPQAPIRYAEHVLAAGPTVFQRACELGADGIVSKRRDLPYRPGRNADWLEIRCLKTKASEASVRGISITTPDRPVYPALGFTKLDLARFYAALAERMLPYITRRPLTLVRCEKGVRTGDALRSECKFLRHEPGWHRWAHPPIQRVQIPERKKIGEYLMVDSPEALVALAQGGIIEIHCWNATVDDLEAPDRIVFDLDPGNEVAWDRVVEAAVKLRDELARLELESWVKLTGGKGLHVVVPFLPEHGWDEVFAFARAAAEGFARKAPELFTLEFEKRGRERKILVDYKRNHRAAVAVAAYSARARPNGSASVPVSWRELSVALSSDEYSVMNVLMRLKRRRSDPWKAFWSSRQRLVPMRVR